jgi:hypothetical protein
LETDHLNFKKGRGSHASKERGKASKTIFKSSTSTAPAAELQIKDEGEDAAGDGGEAEEIR